MEPKLSFADLRRANLLRLPLFRDRKGRIAHSEKDGQPFGFDWTVDQWLTALTGELGEFASLIKQINRGDVTFEEKRQDIADELADVQTYLDLLSYRLGVDLDAALLKKWNEVSERVKADVWLAPAEPKPATRLGLTFLDEGDSPNIWCAFECITDGTVLDVRVSEATFSRLAKQADHSESPEKVHRYYWTGVVSCPTCQQAMPLHTWWWEDKGGYGSRSGSMEFYLLYAAQRYFYEKTTENLLLLERAIALREARERALLTSESA